MKRIVTLMASLALLSWGTALADPVEFIHPKKDKDGGTQVVTADGVLYHGMGYPNVPPTFYGGWVSFVSENEGDPVTINFSEFDCLRGERSIVYLYDGDAILKEQFTSYSKPAPEGYMKALTPADTGVDFVAESGVLSVLYAPSGSYDAITGNYTAMVTAGTPKDMEFKEAVATNAGANAWRGAGDVALLTLSVKMDGTLNPLMLNRLAFDLTDVSNSGLVENVRLYAGSVDDDNLLASLGEGAASIEVTDRELKGKNIFMVVADVKADAAGSVPLVSVSELNIDGVARAVDAATLSPLTVADEVRMAVGDVRPVYTISGETSFYDAGGPAANVPQGSEGSLTFVPAEAGQKVKVDVTSLKLFNTSSTGLNDVFRFYNGREVDDGALMAELLTDTKIVKSTADDGSLTVYFKSVAGTPKEGWEASVSQFTPGPMTLAGVEAEDTEITSAYAGEKDVILLLFNVKTDDQLNSLSVSGVSLCAADVSDAGALSAVKIYSLGEKPNYATVMPSMVCGEATWSGTSMSVPLEKSLVEGNNWFAVAVDIAENALVGQVAGATLSGVTIGGQTTVPTGDLSATVAIDNTCVMTAGAHSHSMYGDWAFKSPAPEGSYSTSYPSGTTDYTVTFRPTLAGAKAQIDFGSFDVYYAASSWGSRATFEVYSGESVNADNLIWKLSDNAQSKTGPGRKLRSVADNGAITVRFNPQASSSSYCGKGWTATVSQFVDHDAEIKAIDVQQASTAILSPGMTNAELLAVTFEVEGTLSPLTLDTFTLEMKGREAVKAVNVLVSPTGSLADATIWGTAAMPAEGNAVTVERSGDVDADALHEELNYFFVTIDVADAIAGDVAVDAKLISVAAGGKSLAVENGDPDGERVARNISLMQPGNGHVVSVAAPIMFYDDGGPDGNLTAGFSGSVTFVPAEENTTLQINAEEFSIGGGKMNVYSGREASEENRLGKSTGYSTTGGPVNLVSKAADGSITITFKANATAKTLKGWAISVTPIAVVPMDVTSVEVTDATGADVLRGSSDSPIARVALTAEGNGGKLAISGISVDFGGSTDVSDIRGARVYYTGYNLTFSPMNPLGEKLTEFDGGKATFTFPAPIEIDEAGTYNFWVAADLEGAAKPGNVAHVAVTAVATTGSPVVMPEANSAARTIAAGMGGPYRVGPSDNARYHTLAEAVEALKIGVEDAVLFMIEDGEYRENLSIVDVQGTSAEHPVVFSSVSGKRDNVVISGSSVLDKQGMVYVDNSSYVHFRNLTMVAPVPASNIKPYATVQFKNGSRHCSIENCVVKAQVLTESANEGTSLVRTADGGAENTNCDFLTVKESRFDGGYIGLYLGGSGIVANPKDKGLSVTGNVITNTYLKAIYLNDCEDFNLSGNSVTPGTGAKKGAYHVDIYRPHGSFRVTGNKVLCEQPTDCAGIYFRNAGSGADASKPSLVANNVVVMANVTSGYTYGVMLETTMANVVFAHNTISLKGEPTVKSAYALALNGNAPADGSAPKVMNNIIQNTTASGPLRPWNASHYANLRFSGNVYYGGGDKMDGDGKTFAEYCEATGDCSSVWSRASFFSDTDLHLREADDTYLQPRLDLVTSDADGKERAPQATAGAYEFATVVVETPEIMEGYPAAGALSDVSATVNTRWTVGGSLYGKAVKADDAAPTREELLAARPMTIDAGAEVAYTFNFLEQLTAYKAYFMVVSALGEESAIVESPAFATKETIEELLVAIEWDETPVNAGETIMLQAYVTGGKEPYSYEWLNQMEDIVGTDDLLVKEAVVNQTYRLRVTSSDGQVAATKAHVPVIAKDLAVATFDDLPLAAESYWKYDRDADEDTFIDAFFSGSFQFGNFPMVQWGAWMGYGYANETATQFLNYDHQFRNAVGGGAANTAAYGVAYMMGADMTIHVSASDAGIVVPGVYVTNAAVTLNSILNGDGYSPKFTSEDGDYMILSFIGLDASGGQTGKVDVPLADYRGVSPQVLTAWEWVDLSSLGAVCSLNMEYSSSKQATVPGYACFDQLGAKNPSSGMEGIWEGGNVRIATPAPDCLSVLGVEGDYILRIYSVDGVLRATSRHHGASTVSTMGIPAGACVAEIVADSGEHTVLRFLKR